MWRTKIPPVKPDIALPPERALFSWHPDIELALYHPLNCFLCIEGGNLLLDIISFTFPSSPRVPIGVNMWDLFSRHKVRVWTSVFIVFPFADPITASDNNEASGK